VGASVARSGGKAQNAGASDVWSEGKAQIEDVSGARSEGEAQSEGGSKTSSYSRELAPFIFILGIVWPHNITYFFAAILRNSKMIISSPGIFNHLLRNDQIHSNSSTFRKISMQRDIIIRRVMTKFTQTPQLLERYPCSEISLSVG
jgi:hypothetical protein